MKYNMLSPGCYQSISGNVEINRLPDCSWAWAIDGIGYDVEPTLKQAKKAVDRAFQQKIAELREELQEWELMRDELSRADTQEWEREKNRSKAEEMRWVLGWIKVVKQKLEELPLS